MLAHTSDNAWSGVQETTSFVMMSDTLVVQLHPVQVLISRTTSALVTTPEIWPSVLHTTTSPVWATLRSLAASTTGAIAEMTIKRSRARGRSTWTDITAFPWVLATTWNDRWHDVDAMLLFL